MISILYNFLFLARYFQCIVRGFGSRIKIFKFKIRYFETI